MSSIIVGVAGGQRIPWPPNHGFEIVGCSIYLIDSFVAFGNIWSCVDD